MRLLLDTDAAAWWWLADSRLPDYAKSVVENSANDVYISAVCAWEIATKHRLGKWPEAAPIVSGFDLLSARSGFTPLPVTVAHARLAGSLQGKHRDPFDRMLVAQAMHDALIVVTRDAAITQYGVLTIWDFSA